MPHYQKVVRFLFFVFVRDERKIYMNKNVKKLTVSAIFIALSTVLSLIPIVQMPLGGKLTLLSMLPVCLIGVMYGIKYAIIPCLAYGLIQTFLGGIFGWGLSLGQLIACMLLDYIVAYGCMAFSGLLRKKGVVGICVSISIAMVGRFVCHFVSGVVLWSTLDVFNNPYIYSLCYNGAYMLPEMILTIIGAVLLFKTKTLDKIKNM